MSVAFGTQHPTPKPWNYKNFYLGNNTDFPEGIFIIHLDYPRFIINLKDDEVEFMEEAEDLDESELNAEMEGLIVF